MELKQNLRYTCFNKPQVAYKNIIIPMPVEQMNKIYQTYTVKLYQYDVV